MPKTPPPISANIRAEMARRGLNQKSLAVALGISQSGISERLAGRIRISADELVQIAALLHVSVELLVSQPVAA